MVCHERTRSARKISAKYAFLDGYRRYFPMADEADPETGGEVRFKVSPQQWAYLGWLSRNTVLGPNEQAVARHLLTQQLSEMRGERFEDGQRS
jgi:hypothetical protein